MRHPTHTDDLQAVRRLLVAPEQLRIEHLEQSLPPTVHGVAEILPEALVDASERRRDALGTALETPVTAAFRAVAQHDPELLGQILAPTIGTAVRRAVKEAFAALTQRINELLERGLSIRSMRWRLEAKRTGQSFAEIVLSHTLVYRVEWVVLLHTQTSLVLEQVSSPEATARAPDQVSAMLQAINSFVSDALRHATPGGELQSFEVGDLSVWIERSPTLTVAAAIRGVPPQSLRNCLRRAIERIDTLHPDLRTERHPDIATFADTRPYIAECLQQQLEPVRNRARWVIVAGLVVLLGAVGWFVHRRWDQAHSDAQLRAQYESALSSPGIVVIGIERIAGGGYSIKGLRDPRAKPAEMLIAAHGLPPAKVELAPYSSLDPGLESPLAAAEASISALEKLELTFKRGASVLDPNDPTLALASQHITRAVQAAQRAKLGLCVEVIGETDASGTSTSNERLRSARAHSVVDALERAGVRSMQLLAVVADPLSTHSRRVTFRAALHGTAESEGCRP